MRRNILIMLLLSQQLMAQQATLTAPDAADIGSKINVTWEGPGIAYDVIYVVEAGAADAARAIHKVSILNPDKKTLPLTVPDQPGQFELRYYSKKAILARRAITINDVAVSLSAPNEAYMGSEIEITWQGPGNNYDQLVLFDSQGENQAHKAILNGTNPVVMKLPEQPGEYELRYQTTFSKRQMGSAAIKILPATINLTAPASADLGSKIMVQWDGQNNNYDRIGVVEAGSADDSKPLFTAAILSQKNPVQIKVPEQAGMYELRYYTAMTKQILARTPLQVGAVETSLQAPDKAEIGSQIQVSWQGPGNDYDRIGVVEKGADDAAKTLADAAILNQKNPLLLKLPEQSGEFELRYYTALSKRILARKPLLIEAVETRLDAPESALAETLIAVAWQGLGNDYDYIGLYQEGSDKAVVGGAILGKKSPVVFKTPSATGTYELRYVTTQDKLVLARRPLIILPTGKLQVSTEFKGQTQAVSAADGLEIILDASGSMLQKLGAERRIDVAKQVLKEFVAENVSTDSQIAMRVFGHRKPDACDTELTLKLGRYEPTALLSHIDGFQAMNLAKTPIADSLAQVPQDLSGVSGLKNVVLITDGEETCDGDPAQVIQSLRDQGLNIQVSVVGFAIADEALKQRFEHWAQLGGGGYFDAQSAADLTRSLKQVVAGPFEVLNSAGEVVAEGVVGGKPLVLAVGTYQVRGKGQSASQEVVIVAAQTTEIVL